MNGSVGGTNGASTAPGDPGGVGVDDPRHSPRSRRTTSVLRLDTGMVSDPISSVLNAMSP